MVTNNRSLIYMAYATAINSIIEEREIVGSDPKAIRRIISHNGFQRVIGNGLAEAISDYSKNSATNLMQIINYVSDLGHSELDTIVDELAVGYTIFVGGTKYQAYLNLAFLALSCDIFHSDVALKAIEKLLEGCEEEFRVHIHNDSSTFEEVASLLEELEMVKDVPGKFWDYYAEL